MLPRGSHRSGRAHFGHPVRQAVALRPVMLPDELAVTGLCGSVPVPWFRPSDPPPGARFPPQGLRRSGFPCFHGTIRRCDFLPPIPPRFVAFAWRYHPARGRMETTGPLTFPGNPNCAFALLYDPGGTERTPGHSGASDMAPAQSTTRAPALPISRLHHTASALAVYAS